MVPTDRQLIDSLLAAIQSTSEFIEMVLQEEIERVCLQPVVNVAQLKMLDDMKREFHLRALIMEYALHVPE